MFKKEKDKFEPRSFSYSYGTTSAFFFYIEQLVG